jgi:hypothetical protein
MKINEITIVPRESKDTTSSATISSIIQADQTQDIVPQNIVPELFEGTIVGSSERHKNKSQETGQSRYHWQEDGPNQKVWCRFGKIERCSNQKDKRFTA